MELEGNQTWTVEDASHWVEVYTEMIRFCQGVLAEPDPAVDREALERHLRHYRRRLAYWESQLPDSH